MLHLLERQLDRQQGICCRELEARGIKVRCNAQIKANLEDGHGEAVLLDDGTIYDADIGVMAVGIRPETRLATDVGLHGAQVTCLLHNWVFLLETGLGQGTDEEAVRTFELKRLSAFLPLQLSDGDFCWLSRPPKPLVSIAGSAAVSSSPRSDGGIEAAGALILLQISGVSARREWRSAKRSGSKDGSSHQWWAVSRVDWDGLACNGGKVAHGPDAVGLYGSG